MRFITASQVIARLIPNKKLHVTIDVSLEEIPPGELETIVTGAAANAGGIIQ